jgi:hypothetical protein
VTFWTHPTRTAEEESVERPWDSAPTPARQFARRAETGGLPGQWENPVPVEAGFGPFGSAQRWKQALSVVHGTIAQIDIEITSSEEVAVAVLVAIKAAGMTFDPPPIVHARKPRRRY